MRSHDRSCDSHKSILSEGGTLVGLHGSGQVEDSLVLLERSGKGQTFRANIQCTHGIHVPWLHLGNQVIAQMSPPRTLTHCMRYYNVNVLYWLHL